jgi:pimeloyl-ACP methyl ester carboxylesterase
MAAKVNVVLAHGAWADGSSWARVIAALKSEGVNVVAAPLPLTSLADDVAAIAETKAKNVRALVYVTALAPDEGEKVADVFYRSPPHPLAPKLAPDDNGLIWLPDEAFRGAFAQQASVDDLAVLSAVQRPISPACITVPVGRPLWKDVPSWFLLAEEDRMILPETQRFMAERMKAQVRVHAVDHAPIVTAPHIVVEIIREAIRSVAA